MKGTFYRAKIRFAPVPVLPIICINDTKQIMNSPISLCSLIVFVSECLIELIGAMILISLSFSVSFCWNSNNWFNNCWAFSKWIEIQWRTEKGTHKCWNLSSANLWFLGIFCLGGNGFHWDITNRETYLGYLFKKGVGSFVSQIIQISSHDELLINKKKTKVPT